MNKATGEIEDFGERLSELGDPAVVDPSVAAPHGNPCSSCGCPIEPLDNFCPACGTAYAPETPAPQTEQAASPDKKHFRCENCSSEVVTDPDQRSYVCPFCDSTYVVEFSPDESQRETPEFIIGFAITVDQANELFLKWIKQGGWFQPGDLQGDAVMEKLKGVYLPFWSYSMLAASEWSASIGEYWYRTETYTTRDSKGRTVTRTRRVRETEWWPLRGRHHHYYSGFMVSGSHGLPQREAERIKPFNLPALKPYEPYYLAGWICEEYSVDKEEALSVCQQEFYQREQANVANFLPGDEHRELNVSAAFSNIQSDLCLLPVYVLSYRYRDRLYRFLVNGQTGRCAGDKPVSRKRIGAAVACGVLLVVAIVIAVVVFQNR